MKQEGNKLIFEKVRCSYCEGTGERERYERCKFTGKSMYGKSCVVCGSTTKNGHRRLMSTGEMCTCSMCNGNGVKLEKASDFLPHYIWETLNFIVERTNVVQDWNQHNVGMGYISSISDYGAYKKITDKELINIVKNESCVQACHVIDVNNNLLPVIITTNDNGYTIKARG